MSETPLLISSYYSSKYCPGITHLFVNRKRQCCVFRWSWWKEDNRRHFNNL